VSDAATESAELAAGFRRLRPVVHEWLARDLTGPPLEYTRAYADLMFAYAFARLAAADDARRLETSAMAVLSVSANAAHGWLLGMFRFRIDEALAGKSNSGTFPEKMEPPSPDLGAGYASRMQEVYVTQRLRNLSRILDPFEVVDPVADWTKSQDTTTRQVHDLRRLRDPVLIADRARAIYWMTQPHSIRYIEPTSGGKFSRAQPLPGMRS